VQHSTVRIGLYMRNMVYDVVTNATFISAIYKLYKIPKYLPTI